MIMRGCIIYDRAVAAKREAYIGLYQKYFAGYGVECRLVFTDSLYEVLSRASFSFAIMRVIAPELSKELEARGIHVYNGFRVSSICNDKWRTYTYLKEHSSLFLLKTETAETFLQERTGFSFPLVIKSRTGHGGTEVFCVASFEKAVHLIGQYPQGSLIVQEMADTPGRDVRVFIVGNRIFASMLRISDTDFRSNYCLGGKAVPYELNEGERQMVEEVMRLFDFKLAGIDFIFHQGRSVLNEIEDVVGTRMLYACTDRDPVREYVKLIVKEEERLSAGRTEWER